MQALSEDDANITGMLDVRDIFKGRKLVIATMHGKEEVLGPVMREALDVEIVVANTLDTDKLGTFSGEIERTMDPITAAKAKCREACSLSGCDMAVASEGSFGPHPTMFFIPGDDEILVFVDLKNKLEVIARQLSTRTNFRGDLFTDWFSARKFARSVKFPSHGLILKSKREDTKDIVKGIRNWKELRYHFDSHIHKYGLAFLETDMRAMHNPTRMGVIKEAAEKLVKTILRTCPVCGTPGYDVVDIEPGLPCELCGSPTKSTISHIYSCNKCGHRTEKKFPLGKTKEDPMYCDWCNP